jgi:hypothetical protein
LPSVPYGRALPGSSIGQVDSGDEYDKINLAISILLIGVSCAINYKSLRCGEALLADRLRVFAADTEEEIIMASEIRAIRAEACDG